MIQKDVTAKVKVEDEQPDSQDDLICKNTQDSVQKRIR